MTYIEDTQSLNPISYLPLNDAPGNTALDASGNGRSGAAANVTFGAPGIGDGNTAAFFNGTSSEINAFSASLAAVYSGAEMTVSFWNKMSPGVWSDGQLHILSFLYAAAGNFAQIYTTSVLNEINFYRAAGGAARNVTSTLDSYAWVHYAIIVSQSGSYLRFLRNGEVLYDLYVVPSFVGSLTKYWLGSNGGAFFTSGWQAHHALWNTALPVGTVRDLARVTNPFAVFYGDSVTAGSGASDTAHSYASLLNNAEGWSYNNSAVSGTILQNTTQNAVATIGGAAANNGRDNYVTHVKSFGADKVVILYGLNDIRLNDVAITAANYQNDLGEIVSDLLATGISAKDIVIGSPPYMNPSIYSSFAPYNGGSTLRHTQFVAAAAAVATLYHTRYANIYQYMLDNGANALIGPDGIHPNDAGHAAIDACFAASEAFTPTERIYTVASENRAFVVPAENRVYIVPGETRIYSVSA